MYREGDVSELSGECRLRKIKEEKAIYPQSTGKLLPEEIPQEYREELKEAYLVLPLSPKASAALSRRLLQKIFHLELKIKKEIYQMKSMFSLLLLMFQLTYQRP